MSTNISSNNNHQSAGENPIVVALTKVFAPLVERTSQLPAPLAYGSAIIIGIFVITLLGAVLPQNLIWLIGFITLVCLTAFIITDHFERTTKVASSIKLINESNNELVLHSNKRLITLGRAPKNMIKITDSSVSWEHGHIIFMKSGYYYRHLSDSSSTTIKSRASKSSRIIRPEEKIDYLLHNQDRLTIGNSTFIIEFDLIAEDSGYIPTSEEPE